MDRRIERTRRAVVDATVDLVSRRGSHVGMTEIAQAAGVSRKAVYENFGSRDQVLLQTTVNLLRAELSLKSATLSGEGDVLERLAHTVADHMIEYRDYYTAVLSGPGDTWPEMRWWCNLPPHAANCVMNSTSPAHPICRTGS